MTNDAVVSKPWAPAVDVDLQNSELEPAQGDAARGAAGWRGRSKAVCGGGAHASVLGQWRSEPEVSNRPRMLRGKERFSRAAQHQLERGAHRVIHTPHDFWRSASGAEMVVSKLDRLALKLTSRHLFVQVKSVILE